MKFELIRQILDDENNVMTVTELCCIAGISRWLNAAPVRNEREKADRADFELILAAYHKR